MEPSHLRVCAVLVGIAVEDKTGRYVPIILRRLVSLKSKVSFRLLIVIVQLPRREMTTGTC